MLLFRTLSMLKVTHLILCFQMDSTDLGEDGLEEGAGGPAGVATVSGSGRGRLPASSTSGSSGMRTLWKENHYIIDGSGR